ncbi:MAG: hypothetical protein KA807_00510 [Prolixibacteraceae bacterium]|nr:hypothetical protein [Prolixibacteraceae bacterium]
MDTFINKKNFETLINIPQEITPEVLVSDVSVEMILKGLGMKKTDAEDYLLEMISELTEQSIKLAEPKAGFVFYNDIQIELQNYKLRISDTIFETGKTVTSLLKKSEVLIVFACTCGDKIENLSKNLMKKGHSLEGLIVDLIGSEITEALAEYLHNFIELEVKEFCMSVSNRYSPGYCNWNVEEQQKLFPLLKGKDCKIKLTSSSLMIPIKSVSGIFGAGHSVKRLPYKCSVCDDEFCILRNK